MGARDEPISGGMDVESGDRSGEQPAGRRRAAAWLVGAVVLAVVLLVASPRGRRVLGFPAASSAGEDASRSGSELSLLLGGPPLGADRVGLYPASDPWQSYLADERSCPGAERTDLPVVQQDQLMLCLINWARRRAGLTELPQTVLLASTSLQKANEILRCDHFAHAACGDDPAEDVRAAGYRGTFGENLYIAGGPLGAPRVALDGWLNSPGHRENLFRPEWRTQGIALVKLARFGVYMDASLWVSHFGSE